MMISSSLLSFGRAMSDSYFRNPVYDRCKYLARVFRPPDSRRAALITDELWRRDFGADPGLIGKTISLDRAPSVVIGILAPRFDFDSDPRPDVWTPLVIDPESEDHAHYFVVAGRRAIQWDRSGGTTGARWRAAHRHAPRDLDRRCWR
jgi:hypothetical protein